MSNSLDAQRYATREELLARTRDDGVGLYQHCSWWQAVEEGLGYRCRGIFGGRDQKNTLSLFFEARKGPFRMIGAPLAGSMTPYQRFWGDSLQEVRPDLPFLLSQFAGLKREGYAWIEWSFAEPAAVLERLEKRIGAQAADRHTFLLDILPDEEQMWKRITSRARNMIRKSRKAGTHVKRCRGTDGEVREFYGMLQGTFAKSGRKPPHSQAFYQSLVRHLRRAARLLFLKATAEGETLAMGLFPHDGREIHFMSGTSRPGVSRFAPNNLIQWEVVRYAMERGIGLYDMGGTGVAAIDRFKASMGGRAHTLPRLIWKASRMRLAERIYLRLEEAMKQFRTRRR